MFQSKCKITKRKSSTSSDPPPSGNMSDFEVDIPDEDYNEVSEAESVGPTNKTHQKKFIKTTSSADAKKKGKTPKHLKFNQVEQEGLRDWLFENPIIWDKGDPDYKDNNKRDKVYRLKAVSLSIEPKNLRTWYGGDSHEIRYGHREEVRRRGKSAAFCRAVDC